MSLNCLLIAKRTIIALCQQTLAHLRWLACTTGGMNQAIGVQTSVQCSWGSANITH